MLSGVWKKAGQTLSKFVSGFLDALTTFFGDTQLWTDLGITSYAYGISASRIHENYYILKYALKKQNPKVIY